MTLPGKAAAGLVLLAGIVAVCAQSRTDHLARGFADPPDSAKSRTWWHWTNGNVTEPGITKDLEWMRRSGIGGFQLVDVGFGAGQMVAWIHRRLWCFAGKLLPFRALAARILKRYWASSMALGP